MDTSSTSRSSSISNPSSSRTVVVGGGSGLGRGGRRRVCPCVQSNCTRCNSKEVPSGSPTRAPSGHQPGGAGAIALDLFIRNGFTETTLDDIATAAGIARRTFFGYFSSKNDVVWGDFDALLRGMEEWLAESDRPTVRSSRPSRRRWSASTTFRPRRCPPTGSACRSSSTCRPCRPTARCATPTGGTSWPASPPAASSKPADALLPQLVGHLALGAAVTAYEQWLADESADLPELLTAAFGALDLRLPRR